MSASDIRAGGAYVELFTRNARLKAGLVEAQRDLSQFLGRFSAFRGLFAGIAAAIAGGLSSLFVFDSVKVGSALADIAARTGLTSDAVAELGYSATLSGTSIEAVEKSIGKMNKTVTAAAAGSKLAAAALSKLGLTAAQLQQLPVNEQFRLIADRLSKISNPAERASAAMAIFGKGASALLPMIADGAAGLDKMAARAREIGAVMSEADVAQADALGDAMDEAKLAIQGVAVSLGSALAPYLIETLQNFSTAAGKVSAFVLENRGLIQSLAEMAIAALKVIGVLLAVKAGFAGISLVTNLVSSSIGSVFAITQGLLGSTIGLVARLGTALMAIPLSGAGLAGAFTAVAGPLAVAIAGVAAMAAVAWAADEAFKANGSSLANFIGTIPDLATAAATMLTDALAVVGEGLGLLFSSLGDEDQAILSWIQNTATGLVGSFKESFDLIGQAFAGIWSAGQSQLLGLQDDAQVAWSGIVSAFNAGDLNAVWSIVGQFAATEWARITGILRSGWAEFRDFFLDGVDVIKTGLAAGMLLGIATIQDAWTTATTNFRSAWQSVVEFVGDSFGAVITTLLDSLATLMKAIDDATGSQLLATNDGGRQNFLKSEEERRAGNRQARDTIAADQKAGRQNANTYREAAGTLTADRDQRILDRQTKRTEEHEKAVQELIDAQKKLKDVTNQQRTEQQDRLKKAASPANVDLVRKAEASANQVVGSADIRSEEGLKGVLSALLQPPDSANRQLELQQEQIDLLAEQNSLLDESNGYLKELATSEDDVL